MFGCNSKPWSFLLHSFFHQVIVPYLKSVVSNTDVNAICKLDYVSRTVDYTGAGYYYLLNMATTNNASFIGDKILQYVTSAKLTGGTIDGIIKSDQITFLDIKINNINVSDYVYGSKKTQTLKDLCDYLLSKGLTVSDLSNCTLNINYKLDVYYDYTKYCGITSGTDLRKIATINEIIEVGCSFQTSAYTAQSVSLDDSSLLF